MCGIVEGSFGIVRMGKMKKRICMFILSDVVCIRDVALSLWRNIEGLTCINIILFFARSILGTLPRFSSANTIHYY